MSCPDMQLQGSSDPQATSTLTEVLSPGFRPQTPTSVQMTVPYSLSQILSPGFRPQQNVTQQQTARATQDGQQMPSAAAAQQGTPSTTFGAPSTLAGGPYATDSQLEPITPTTQPMAMTLDSLQYLNGALRTQIGSKVTVQFLIGTNTFQDRTGTLLAVGANYIIINETDTDDILFCDYYSIKFVKVYR